MSSAMSGAVLSKTLRCSSSTWRVSSFSCWVDAHLGPQGSQHRWRSGWWFYFGAMPCGMWDLSSLTRDPARAPALKCDVLTTGPPGRSKVGVFRYWGKRRKDDCTLGGFGHEYLGHFTRMDRRREMSGRGAPGLGGFWDSPGEEAGCSPVSESNGVRQIRLHHNWLPVPGADGGAGWQKQLQTTLKQWVLGG